MNLVISGKNIDITEGLRAAVEEKIGKLERYFNDSTCYIEHREESSEN